MQDLRCLKKYEKFSKVKDSSKVIPMEKVWTKHGDGIKHCVIIRQGGDFSNQMKLALGDQLEIKLDGMSKEKPQKTFGLGQ